MPRYFFDVHDGIEHRDAVGLEIEDSADLKLEALRFAAALTEANANKVQETAVVLTVRDTAGLIPLRLRLICQLETP